MPNYIMDLRRLVGHRPLLMPAASVILEDGEGRVLLQLRADNGLWCYHGGAVELDEVVEDAARRELWEETGLESESLELLGVYSGPELHFCYPNGDEVSVIDHVYRCRHWHGTLRAQEEEVSTLRWFCWDELPEDLMPSARPAFRDWLTLKRRESDSFSK